MSAGVDAGIRVRYEETDAMGVVYHANYLRYFEVGRVELLRSLGISYRDLEARGARLAVVETRMRFRAPARFDDLLVVRCRLGRLRAARVELSYEVLRSPEERLVSGETVLASLDVTGRPCRLPEALRSAFGAAASRSSALD